MLCVCNYSTGEAKTRASLWLVYLVNTRFSEWAAPNNGVENNWRLHPTFTYAHLIIYAHEYIHMKNHVDLYATVAWKLSFLSPFILILKASHGCFHLEQMKVQVTGYEEEGSMADLLLISFIRSPVKIEDVQVSHICGSILLSVQPGAQTWKSFPVLEANIILMFWKTVKFRVMYMHSSGLVTYSRHAFCSLFRTNSLLFCCLW